VNRSQLLELLARLPARVWLQAALGLLGFIVLAVLGFAVIAGILAVVLVVIFAFKAKAWLAGLMGRKAGPPSTMRQTTKVIDVQYEIVDRDERR
jgi:hypothetical protein